MNRSRERGRESKREEEGLTREGNWGWHRQLSCDKKGGGERPRRRCCGTCGGDGGEWKGLADAASVGWGTARQTKRRRQHRLQRLHARPQKKKPERERKRRIREGALYDVSGLYIVSRFVSVVPPVTLSRHKKWRPNCYIRIFCTIIWQVYIKF